MLRNSARLPQKDVDDLTRHVQRSENDSGEHQVIRCARRRPMAYIVKNFLFRPAAGEKEREAAERHHPDGVRHKSDRHEPPETAHVTNVLFDVTSVNDEAGAEETKRLD